jgi:pimeloyl-ACP methyl ester carboxylesterase
MTIAIAAIAILAGLFFAAWAHLHYWVRRLTLSLPYATTEQLETPDGARIELRRVPIPGDVERAALPPVLLVHGVGANYRNQDLHPDHSLARYLASMGRDVWLLTLRSGLGRWTRAEAARVRFAAMVHHDVPLGVEAVLARTGAVALDYVGFSMGGMLLYAALGRTLPRERVRRVVTVGSPGRVNAPALLVPLLKRVPRWLVPAAHNKRPAQAFAFAVEWVRTPLHRMFYNPTNVSAGLARAALVNMVEDTPAPLNADFLEWAATGGDIRIDGERALDGLATIDAPASFFAGNADRMAPPAAVKAAFDAWGSAREGVTKRLLVLGKDFGARADYGHGDLAMGTHVAVELFEPIAKFLGPESPDEARGPETGERAREEVFEREATR